MPKCNLNKVAKQTLLKSQIAWVFSCKFVAYFHNTFSYRLLWRAASVDRNYVKEIALNTFKFHDQGCKKEQVRNRKF